jgi:hypothetical protein
MSMRAALDHPGIFGTILPGASWASWRVLLIASMGEELTEPERAVFLELTGRDHEPGERVEELWAIVGRRGGKTRAIAVLAAYIASLVDFSDILAPGERASLPIISASLNQAQKCFQYLDGIYANVAALKRLVTGQTSDTIALSTRVDIECRPASFRTIRGGTACAIICDEIAFWRSDNSANPDTEILNAARPMLATTGGLLAAISSPYAQRGELHGTFKRDYGPNGDAKILVAKAPSLRMNPTLKKSVVDRAYQRDAAAASAEYDAEFRKDVSGWADLATIESAVDYGVTVRPPETGQRRTYRSFCDPSGGASDSFTMAIAHDEENIAVLDCLVEIKAPFNPTSATKQIAEVLKSYGLTSTTGDKYAAQWVVDAFAKVGIKYSHSERDRSAIYLDALPLFTSGRVRLLDNKRLVAQFASLERRTSSGGKDRVDHGPGGHDDVCNSAAGALVARGRGPLRISPDFLTRATQSAPPVFFHTSKRRV